MGNMLEDSSAWLEAMRKKHLASSVKYCRDGECVIVQATVGRTVFQIARDMNPFERFESRDYLVTATDLVFQGNAVLPRRGDTIREEQDGKVYVYEVMAPGTEPHFRYSDPYRKTLRIHTKLVGMEEV